ncbi:MAG: tRNA (guanosine(37)-N1)-methyltransferase TrmD [Candidatus Orphnella occulta]|nr:tRNA (guanosine(37)-N1)-methyltransferase TrmD [Candidatus Orphnella occulta]
MKIDILTLFPGMFEALISESIIERAQRFSKVSIRTHNIRDFTTNKHRKVDDKPFGGGPGMVLQCQPVIDTINSVKALSPRAKVILMSPRGKILDHSLCLSLSKAAGLILVCGHYEGADERIRGYVDQEISIGDYILTGGELPAMVLVDSVVRLLPGVLGHDQSNIDESFSNGLLEYSQYTRPADYSGKKVPELLVSGNHNIVKSWRKKEAVFKTMYQRPDLIKHISQLEI